MAQIDLNINIRLKRKGGMQTRNCGSHLLLLGLFLLLLCPSCIVRFRDRCQYRFDDVAYRNMRLEFWKNGQVYLGNNAGLGFGFGSYGEWKVCGENIVIQIYNVRDTFSTIEYPKQGDTIDVDRLLNDTLYRAFPRIIIDTVSFSKDQKLAYLKGFVFTHFDNTLRLKSLLRKHRKHSSFAD